MAAFLVMLREGVEAALIVGILLAYVSRLELRRLAQWVWAGTISAALLSVMAGIVIFSTIGSLDERAEEIAEGVVAWVAAGLLTWMIFWMGSQARHIRGRLESEVDMALISGGGGALAAIAFFAVLREGLESALFLISTTVGTRSMRSTGWATRRPAKSLSGKRTIRGTCRLVLYIQSCSKMPWS